MRRAHTKSRRGCNECKRRKIKCDENHPQCSHCSERRAECSFGIKDQPPKVHKEPIPISRSSIIRGTTSNGDVSVSTFARPSSVIPLPLRPNAVAPISGSSNRQRMLDLQLFHHFTTQMIEVPFEDPAIKETFTVRIPTLALQDACFLDAHLAISALHLSTQHPTNSAMVSATFEYIGSAMRQLQTMLLVGLSETNAEAACITAILIALHSCMSSNISGDLHQVQNFSLRWIQTFQGISTVLRAAWPWVQDSRMVKMFITSKLRPSDYRKYPDIDFSFLVNDLDVQTDPTTRKAYEFAVIYANCALENPRERYLPLFLMRLPPRYVQLVNKLDPRSLVILGVHFSMAQMLAGEFLLENTALREVQSIRRILPDQWGKFLDRAENIITMRYNEEFSGLIEIHRNRSAVPQPLYF